MKYFNEIKSKEELIDTYRKLSLKHHPDKGGNVSTMQDINQEYSEVRKTFGIMPEALHEARIGNFIYVNNSTCIVVDVTHKMIKARSLTTKREALFDKETGYGLFNLKLKAYV